MTEPTAAPVKIDRAIILAVLVAALGYFVDIYDLLLFSIVRVSSLKSLGVPDDLILSKGVFLFNTQMAGLLIGGILWGILGDKKGRLSVLFGSILLYSLANLGNAFVQNVEQYAVLRFIAGVGLAGELGAGITLVSEILPQRLRGFGTAAVASIGILGAVFGGLVGDLFQWRTSFIIGGVMGLLVLLLRVGVRESGMFNRVKEQTVARGKMLMLFTNPKLLKRYLAVIFVGMPLWYVVGVLVTLTPEFGRAFGMDVLPTAAKAVMFNYLGLSIGDFMSAMVSQYLESRKKTIFIYLVLTGVAVAIHLAYAGSSLPFYYFSCAFMGLFCGYWAMFVTVAAEQFGTNLRSTVATTAPNFVRGSVIPLNIALQALTPMFGLRATAGIIGACSIAISLVALLFIQETFHKDLDYHEG